MSPSHQSRMHQVRHRPLTAIALLLCLFILVHHTLAASATVAVEGAAAEMSVSGSGMGSTGLPTGGNAASFASQTPPLPSVCTDGSILAIGDLHGDLYKLQQLLAAAGVVSGAGHHWRTGCRATVVQLGDMADRGLHPHSLYEYVSMLEKEAAAQSGEFTFVLGNHELMNLLGQTHYVNPRLFKDVFSNERDFTDAFAPTGAYGKFLLAHPVALVRRGVVFVHGGLTLPYAQTGIAAVNANFTRYFASRAWRSGTVPAHPYESANSPLWDRSVLTQALREGNCEPLTQSLAALSAVEGETIHTMVVGHTLVPDGTPRTDLCHGSLVVTDVGLSDAMFASAAKDGKAPVAYGFAAMVKLTPTPNSTALAAAAEVIAPWGLGTKLVIPARVTTHHQPAPPAWLRTSAERRGEVMQSNGAHGDAAATGAARDAIPADARLRDKTDTVLDRARAQRQSQLVNSTVDETPYIKYGLGLMGIVLLLLIPCGPAGKQLRRASGVRPHARKPRSTKRVTFVLPTDIRP